MNGWRGTKAPGRRLIRRISCCLALAASVANAHPVSAAPTIARSAAQFIVRYQGDLEGVASVDQLSRATATDLSYVRRMGTGADVLRAAQPMTTTEARRFAAALAAQPGVASAVVDVRRTVARTPNDTLYATRQWNLNDASGGINAEAAWDITTGDADVVVAVIDTGVLTDHPDLPAERVLPGYDFISDPFTANDGDGRDSNATDPGDWIGAADVALGAPCEGLPTEASSWHGTSVAGLIAAQGDNARDIAGVAWGVRILPVRVMGKCGGYDSDIIDGMFWAAGLNVADPAVPANPHPARILNLSLGGPGAPCAATAYPDAIAQLTAAGVIVVVAAGNDGGAINTPANCAGVIAVGASDRGGDLSSFSSRGGEMTLSAPGGDLGSDPIVSLSNTGATTPVSPTWRLTIGTSDAAPQVSGTAALLLSIRPFLPPDEVATILATTARPYTPGSPCLTTLFGDCGAGRLDAGAAVSATLSTLPSIATLDPNAASVGGPAFTLTVNGAGYVDGSVVLWNNVALATTFVSSQALNADVPAALIATPGPVDVRVANPAPAGRSFFPSVFLIGSRLFLPTLQRAPQDLP